MPTFHIKHLTQYTYTQPVIDGANQIMLYPIINEFQKVVDQKINVSTNPKIATYNDFCGNTVGTFMITEPHNFVSIESEIEVHTSSIIYPEDKIPAEDQWEALKPLRNDISFMDFLRFIRFDGTEEIADMLVKYDLNEWSPYRMAVELCSYIHHNFQYAKGITTVDSKLDDVWRLKAGVCQDFTNIFLQMIRMLGIPARYVSGYICPSTEASRGEGATHAWIEAYIPFYGWLGLDPTNDIITSEHHVKLAVGRNYHDCAPVVGVYKGDASDDLFVKVKVSHVKKNNDSLVFPEVNDLNASTNRYRQNLELIQQQQQQQ